MFLMNSPCDPPFNIYHWYGLFEYRVDDRYDLERQWLFEWVRNLGCETLRDLAYMIGEYIENTF